MVGIIPPRKNCPYTESEGGIISTFTVYAIINNKKFEGYNKLFENIYNILSLEHSIDLNVK